MPQGTLDNVDVDHCVPAAEMGALLATLIRQPLGAAKPIPEDVRIEAAIAERVLIDVRQVNALGSQVPYNCPNCGGALWEMKKSESAGYRCHAGHSFTRSALPTSQNEKIEETLWISPRMLEERKNLLKGMLQSNPACGSKRASAERMKAVTVNGNGRSRSGRRYIPSLSATIDRVLVSGATGGIMDCEKLKRTATAEEIQAEIARRLQYAAPSERRCKGCAVPTPVLLLERRGDGVNWSITAFPNVPAGCTSFLMKVLSEVMYSYDLIPTHVPEHIRTKRKESRSRRRAQRGVRELGANPSHRG